MSSLPPSSDVGERFQECYRGYLQGGKTTDSSFRSLVRRLVRRVHGALVNLFYIGAEVEISGNLSKPLLDAIAAFRGDQTHMTVGLTPESLRKMRLEVETLNRKLSKLGYATPTDPWSDFSKLQSGASAALSVLDLSLTTDCSGSGRLFGLRRVAGSFELDRVHRGSRRRRGRGRGRAVVDEWIQFGEQGGRAPLAHSGWCAHGPRDDALLCARGAGLTCGAARCVRVMSRPRWLTCELWRLQCKVPVTMARSHFRSRCRRSARPPFTRSPRRPLPKARQ